MYLFVNDIFSASAEHYYSDNHLTITITLMGTTAKSCFAMWRGILRQYKGGTIFSFTGYRKYSLMCQNGQNESCLAHSS
jgi:hypothetical protein